MRISDNMDKTRSRSRSMPAPLSVASPKKATNITLPESLLVEAKTLDINISKAAEIGVAQAVAKRRAELWR
jgi:antitoxin CcdA